ncbi:hypothetical protein HMPREF0240_01331 [Clostridium sp. D5]|nr:hypothetical protein HMPREF0240_01331 [Clostridium sp. D5]
MTRHTISDSLISKKRGGRLSEELHPTHYSVWILKRHVLRYPDGIIKEVEDDYG